MTEVERLVLQVESNGIGQVNIELSIMDGRVQQAQKSWTGFGIGIASAMAVAYASFRVVSEAVSLLVTATESYQDFNAALKVSTGSAEKAAIAYQAIKDYASSTPYSVKEVTQAFIQLSNLGLDPSQKALVSYGNTASSLNKSLTDIVRIVAEAATGQFRGLRELGIVAAKQGSDIQLTFRGVKTTIQDTTQAIQGYLIGLGQVEFAGAMEERMKGLSGAVSNMKDAWDQLWEALEKEGAGALITQTVHTATLALDELKKELESGQIDKLLAAQRVQWGLLGQDIVDSAKLGTNGISSAVIQWVSLFGYSEKDLKGVFDNLPLYARDSCEHIYNYFEKMVNDIKSLFNNGFTPWFDNLFSTLSTKVDILKNKISEWSSGNFNVTPSISDQFSGVDALYAKTKDANAKTLKDSLDANKALYTAKENALSVDTAREVQSVDELFAAATAAREKYNKAESVRTGNKTDVLAQFNKGDPNEQPKGDDKGSNDAKKAADKARALEEDLLKKRLEFLSKGVLQEHQVIAHNYDDQREIILKSTTLTLEQKKALTLKLLENSIVSEQDGVKQDYKNRMDFVLSATELSEAEKTALIVKLTKSRNKELSVLEQKENAERLTQAAGFFSNLSTVSSIFGKKGFEATKALGIASALIDTYKAATGAYASLAAIPLVGPELGAAAAAAAIVTGLGHVAQIKSSTYSGAFEQGGLIPSGKYGLVGEAGPEFVQGPAIVTSAAATRTALSGGSVKTVTVHNFGQPVQATSKVNGEELMIYLKPILEMHRAETKSEISNDIHRGGSVIARRMEAVYGLTRTGHL